MEKTTFFLKLIIIKQILIAQCNDHWKIEPSVCSLLNNPHFNNAFLSNSSQDFVTRSVSMEIWVSSDHQEMRETQVREKTLFFLPWLYSSNDQRRFDLEPYCCLDSNQRQQAKTMSLMLALALAARKPTRSCILSSSHHHNVLCHFQTSLIAFIWHRRQIPQQPE